MRRIGANPFMRRMAEDYRYRTAMFASFGEGQELFIKCMNGITGTVVSVLALRIGIYSICSANKMKRRSADAGGIGNDKNTCGGG